MTAALDALRRHDTILLTTHRRDGRAVTTPVSIAFDGDRAFFRTWDTAGKAKRLRRDPNVEVAPSTFWGRPTGPAITGHARLLQGADDETARHVLARRFPLLHGLLVPLMHRLRGNTTVHYLLEERGAVATRPTPA